MLPRRAWLGAELASDDHASTGPGLAIAGVDDGGMAARAGMQAGDRLVSLAGLAVAGGDQLAAALRAATAAPSATGCEVVFVRGGERRVTTVEPVPLPAERGAHYREVAVPGARLRTIRVGECSGGRGLVVVIPGIANDSVDCALAPDAPLAGLVGGWESAGYPSVRFDKRGVGDSEGNSSELDFATELADARAVVSDACELASAHQLPVLLFGHGVGGVIASRLADAAGVVGVAVYGAPVSRWIDCVRNSARRQAALLGAPPDELAARLADIDRSADQLDGRPPIYHAQLAAIDVAAGWRAVSARVLIVRGEHDWVVDPEDQVKIASLVDDARVVDIPGLDHLMGWHASAVASVTDYGGGRFDRALVAATVRWFDAVVRPLRDALTR